MNYDYITNELLLLKNESASNFLASLTPNCKPVLGVKVGDIRKISKFVPEKEILHYLENAPEEYEEQLILKGALISRIKNINTALNELEKFLPKICDWCVCDTFCTSFKIAKKEPEAVLNYLYMKASSNDEFTERVVAVLVLSHFLTDKYIDEAFKILDMLSQGAYYVDMAIGWAVATALAKQHDKTVAFLNRNTLSDRTYNFTVAKMHQSLRISDEDKQKYKKRKI